MVSQNKSLKMTRRSAIKLIQVIALTIQLSFLLSSSTEGRVLRGGRRSHNEAQHGNGKQASELLRKINVKRTGSVEDATQNLGLTVQNLPDPEGLVRTLGSSSYIVTLSNGTSSTEYVGKLKKVFQNDLSASSTTDMIGYIYDDLVTHGFSARFSTKVLEYVSQSPEVIEVVPDTTMHILPIVDSIFEIVAPPQSFDTESAKDSEGSVNAEAAVIVQRGTAPWNLQRISQRAKFSVNDQDATAIDYDYSYKEPNGQNIVVYVLDTGARASHTDFEGRVEMAAQFGGYDLSDGNGHGTHCAGVITGKRWGVAKRSQVKAVKVLSDAGQGSTSDIIAGIQYVMKKHRDSQLPPSVISLSLGGSQNSALDRAVKSAIDQGIHVVVAAGNSNADACQSSPAAAPNANVVAASNIQDDRAAYSNWGSCVSLFAPGSNVTSTWSTSNTAVARISGTSMAAPHVAGLIAYHLSQQNMNPSQMSAMLKTNSNHGKINQQAGGNSKISSTANELVYNMVQ